MARYDYRCTACGNAFEVEHAMGEHPEVVCPLCGAPAERIFSTSGIVFEGSGFYNTDQRGSKKPSATSRGHEGSGEVAKGSDKGSDGPKKAAATEK